MNVSTSYQGHHADGSSIQRHSAGALYPYVLAVRERDDVRTWELIGPGLDSALSFPDGPAAMAAAQRLVAVRDIDDAWEFELGRVCTFAGQRLAAMVGAAERLAGSGRSALKDMSKTQRVACLLELGRVRNGLRLPAGGAGSAFAVMAAAEARA